ncbi:MAG: CBS domain-containing protein, partial [Cyclobacteriaceae bacterium]|nr:CBS domain-containing protein [Cyclobacteriaceae bacterium]
LLQLRGFSSQDFARVHPGGSLGKRLYLKVEDIYVNNELPVVSVEMGTEDVIMEITAKRLGAAAVTDPDGQLCGIITDGDLRRMLATQPQWQLLKAKDIMGNKPKTLDKGAYAVEALELMQQNNITQIIVMNKNKIAGFVHLHDLLKEGIV